MGAWQTFRLGSVLLAVTLLMSVTLLQAEAQTAVRANHIHFCYLPQYWVSTVTGHIYGRFAMNHFAPQFPGLTWQWSVYARDGNKNFTTTIASLLSQPDDCTFLIGPGTSRYSIAVSPLVSRPWVSASASSTSLSDKQAHKWFSRMIPSDSFGGAGLAAVVRHFGWSKVHVVCSDEPYGVSLTAGFTTAYTPYGTVESATCFPLVDTEKDQISWITTLRRIRDESGVRIVVIAHVEPTDIMVNAILSLGMQRTHVFVFGEICDQSMSVNSSRELLGSLCATYAVTGNTEFEAVFQARDQTQDIADIANLGLFPASASFDQTAIYDAFYVDLVRHAMGSMHDLYLNNGSALHAVPANYEAIMAAFRAHNSTGFTGNVSLTSRGDRTSATVAFINLQPEGHKVFAHWSPDNGTTVLDSGLLYWLASGFRGVPAAFDVEKSEIPITIVIGALCGSVVLLLFGVMFFKLRTASPEVYAQLIRSGIAVTVGKIIAHAVDIATDVISCVVVVTRDVSSSTFVIVYICLTVVAVTASLAEVVVLILQFLDTLQHKGDLSVAQEVEWEKRLARTAVISLIAEDLPMSVIATVAIQQQADVPLLISLLLSTILFGTKATYIPPLVQSIMRRKRASHVGMESAQSGAVLHSATPPIALDAAAAEIQSENPDRYEQLRQHAVDAVVLCREQQIDQNEFFAGVWQRTAVLYETGGTAMDETMKEGGKDGGEKDVEAEAATTDSAEEMTGVMADPGDAKAEVV